jgi:hypothetical protein
MPWRHDWLDKAARLGCCQVLFINPFSASATLLEACSRGGLMNAHEGRDKSSFLGLGYFFSSTRHCPSHPVSNNTRHCPNNAGGNVHHRS